MKKILLFVLIYMCFQPNIIFSQVSIIYLDTDEFRMIEDKKSHRKFKSSWETAIGISRSKELKAETKNELVIQSINRTVSVIPYDFIFDKKTGKLKNATFGFPNDEPFYKNNKVVDISSKKDKKDGETVRTWSYSLNFAPDIPLENSDFYYKNIRVESLAKKKIIASVDDNSFGLISSIDGTDIDIRVYDKDLKFQKKATFTIPKGSNQSEGLLVNINGGTLSYTAVWMGKNGNSVHFIDCIVGNEFKVVTYDFDTKKVKTNTINLADLGIYYQNTGKPKPKMKLDFRGDEVVIYAFSMPKEKASGKYKRQVGQVTINKLSFPELKSIHQDKIDLTNALFEELQIKNKKAFDNWTAAIDELKLYRNETSNQIEAISIVYLTANPNPQYLPVPTGGFYIKIKEDKFVGTPFVQKGLFHKKNYILFSIKDQDYKLVKMSRAVKIYEINGEEEKMIHEFKPEFNRVLTEGRFRFGEDFMLWFATEGVMKITIP